MMHLDHETLSALVDGALPAARRAKAESHLAACEACREALEALRTQDALLESSLAHDPGEAYFERFAERVEARIRVEGAAAGAAARAHAPGADDVAPTPKRSRLGDFLAGRFAWATGAMVLVVGAGIVLLTLREGGAPDLRDHALMERLDGSQAAPERQADDARSNEAPPAGDAARPMQVFDAPETPARAQEVVPGEGAGAIAAPGRAREMRRTESGEDVPVRDDAASRFAAPRTTTPPAPAGEPAYAPKPGAASPLASSEAAREAEGTADALKSTVSEKTAASRDAAAKSAPSKSVPERPLADSKRESGTRSGFAPPPATSSLARDSKATGSRPLAQLPAVESATTCGVLRDAAGRPLAGVQVVVADLGITTRSGADGRFCVDAPPGDHTLTAMAVGFVPWRATVAFPSPDPVAITLAAADVLGGGKGSLATNRVPDGSVRPLGAPRPTALDEDAAVSAEASALVREAQRLDAEAAREPSAARWDAAAGAWGNAIAPLGTHPLALDARWSAAQARVKAWEIAPTPARASAARLAVDAFLARAPEGSRRTQAEGWKERLAP